MRSDVQFLCKSYISSCNYDHCRCVHCNYISCRGVIVDTVELSESSISNQSTGALSDRTTAACNNGTLDQCLNNNVNNEVGGGGGNFALTFDLQKG